MTSAPLPFDLTGRSVLITGASSGLGAHFATVVGRAGARVVVGARRIDRLTSLVETLAARGISALAVEMDVTSERSVVNAFDEAEAAFGPIDSIIANAGVNASGSALKLPVEDFEHLMAANVTGVFLTVREGVRRMIGNSSKTSGNGRVVIISSNTAHSIHRGLAPYSASKAAVLHMGRVLARDWAGSGVNINVLCPGYIPTAINDAWFSSEGGANQISEWPRPRLMEAADLDAMLLYLTSSVSRAVTGSVFTIDDGQSLAAG